MNTPSHTQVWVIRHGQTDWNRDKRFQGQLDVPLNAVGHTQAQQAGDYIAQLHQRQPFDGLVSSPLSRAAQTADGIHRAIESAGSSIQRQTAPLWAEQHFGLLQGLTLEQMRVEQPEHHTAWDTRDPYARYGTGESLADLHERAWLALQAVAQQYAGKRVLVVTHGGVLNALYRRISEIDFQTPRTWSIQNASVNVLECDAASHQWRIAQWGYVDHLHDTSDELVA